MLYNELFLNYKHTLPSLKVLLEVKPIRRRFGVLIILLFLFVLTGLSLFIFYDTLSDLGCSIYGGISAIIMCTIGVFLENIDRLDIKDLLRHYRNIDFSEHEKKDKYLMLYRIKKEKLSSLLAEKKYDLVYIKQLIEVSKELSEYSKIQLVSIKEIGFSAVIVLLLNQYFSTLYKKWEFLRLRDLTKYTLLILFVFILFFFLYSIVKKITSDWLNSDYRKHKELYLLLKQMEELAIYNKIGESDL